MMSAAVTVAAMTLGELLGSHAGLNADLRVSDLVSDSRDVTPGSAFVALPGTTTHGLEFADEALARGAAVVIYEPDPAFAAAPEPSVAVPGLKSRLGELAAKFYRAQARPTEIVGITGTNGKTTVAWLLAQASAELGAHCGYIGTLGYGKPPALTPHRLTTPDCLSLHREIAVLATDRIALEVSSHALAQDRIAGLVIRTAVLTNLSRDHLDQHGSMTAYADAKATLFLRPGVRDAVLNFDDDFGRALVDRVASGVNVIGTSVGGGGDANLRARVDAHGLDGLVLDIDGDFGRAVCRSSLIGDFNAENLLVVLGALIGGGHELQSACRALGACRGAPGRLEVFGGGDRAHVIVDYAHTPAALARVLDVVKRAGAGRVTCVFGCGGDRDRGKRAVMGRIVAARADRIVLTDDNPRHEDPAAIVADIRTGLDGADAIVIHDRRDAIVRAVREARAGDVVLVAGKGHEPVQWVGDDAIPLDDRELVIDALGGRS